MRDPFSWSFPLGRLFGITVRIHILFPLFILGIWGRVAFDKDAVPGAGLSILVLMALLFIAVLLHELGHAFAARLVEGDCREVLLWPLGGLARCEVPHTARANLICAMGGPAVNLLLCLFCALALAGSSLVPPLNPISAHQVWRLDLYNWADGKIYGSEYSPSLYHLELWQVLVARLFWLSWVQFLFNVLLVGFPFDGGRILQCLLWPRYGYRQALLTAITTGFIVVVLLMIVSLVWNEVFLLLLAYFTYQSCKQEWIQLETGSEDSLFGYDFSQGYTSLERDVAPPVVPRKKRPNFIQRWWQRRAARKQQRQQEQAEADERRMDELLIKIQREGKGALTEEEQRFLKRVADRYRNRP